MISVYQRFNKEQRTKSTFSIYQPTYMLPPTHVSFQYNTWEMIETYKPQVSRPQIENHCFNRYAHHRVMITSIALRESKSILLVLHNAAHLLSNYTLTKTIRAPSPPFDFSNQVEFDVSVCFLRGLFILVGQCSTPVCMIIFKSASAMKNWFRLIRFWLYVWQPLDTIIWIQTVDWNCFKRSYY